MPDPNPAEPPDSKATAEARKDLKKAETGDAKAAGHLNSTRKSDPVATEAAEQEAADGPEGRGLAR